MRRIPAVAVLMFGCGFALGCEAPVPRQVEGKPCSLALGEYERCVPGLYCQPATGLASMVQFQSEPVGTCLRHLKEGEGCVNRDATCEAPLICQAQSGVCRRADGISREPVADIIVD